MKPVLSEEIEVQNIELVRLAPDVEDAGHDRSRLAQLRRLVLRQLPFVLMVLLPSVLATVYFFGFAAARYVSEVKYVVRMPGSSATTEIASLVQGTGVMRSSDDAFIAKEYILSRDAMQQLVDKDGLLKMFAEAGRDMFWSYPGLFRDANTVDLAKHYLRFVEVDYDGGSGISTLSVQAFNAADAQRLAAALISHTEGFLNSLNGRAQQDAVKSAVRDVDIAKQAAYKALDAVTDFRNAEETVDPTKASQGIVQSISTLSLETSTTNARLAELVTSTPQSPEIPTLRSRVAALQAQITKQRQQLGGDTASLAPQIARYQRLLLDQQFAEKAFISALTSLESARLDATRQRVFLEEITNPDLPDYAAYPYRAIFSLATIGTSFAVWRIFRTIGKDTREHGQR